MPSKKTKSSSEKLRHMLGTTEQLPVKIDRARHIVAPKYLVANGEIWIAEPGEPYKPAGSIYQSGQIINAVARKSASNSRRYENPNFTQRSKGALASKQRP